MDRAGSSFEPGPGGSEKCSGLAVCFPLRLATMKRGVPRYTRRFFCGGVDYLRCSEGADCYCGPDNAQLWLDGLRAGCKECFPFKEKYGSLVGVPADRKRGTGGRSRTLAPPRGAAWIVDCFSCTWVCVRGWEMN